MKRKPTKLKKKASPALQLQETAIRIDKSEAALQRIADDVRSLSSRADQAVCISFYNDDLANVREAIGNLRSEVMQLRTEFGQSLNQKMIDFAKANEWIADQVIQYKNQIDEARDWVTDLINHNKKVIGAAETKLRQASVLPKEMP